MFANDHVLEQYGTNMLITSAEWSCLSGTWNEQTAECSPLVPSISPISLVSRTSLNATKQYCLVNKPMSNLKAGGISLPGEQHFELTEWPFYWIVKVYGQYLNSLEGLLKAVDLDIPRWRVLMLLEGTEGFSVSYLADEAITKLSTMTRIVQRMQDDGLVSTRPRASDLRVTEVLLTSEGRRARELAYEQANNIYTTSFDGLSSQQIETLNRTLSKLYSNLVEPCDRSE